LWKNREPKKKKNKKKKKRHKGCLKKKKREDLSREILEDQEQEWPSSRAGLAVPQGSRVACAHGTRLVACDRRRCDILARGPEEEGGSRFGAAAARKC